MLIGHNTYMSGVKNTPTAWKNEVKLARDLGYSKNVVSLLRQESDPMKRQRILQEARLGNIR